MTPFDIGRKLRLAAGGKPVKDSRDGYDVFLIAGQSNALGAGLGYDSKLDRARKHVHQFAGSGPRARKLVSANHPLFHQTPAPGVGFGTTFGNLHVEAFTRPVLLVPVARGESGFSPNNGYSWDVRNQSLETSLFRFACQQLDTALNTGPGRTLRGILWHQGEWDVYNKMEAGLYTEEMEALIDGFRDRFGTVPFLLGQMSPDRMAEHAGSYPDINAAQHAIPSRIEKTAFVGAPSGMYNSPDDKVHFNAAGQRELGRRYFESYRRLFL